jgi:KaiC/GvpD/RAD55 family RecA-like ATPase
MFERAAAIATGIETGEIEKRYLCGEGVEWQAGGKLEKLLVCTAGVNMKQVDEEICRSSAKFGCTPKVFVVDYIQLIRGAGNRYERVSEAREEAKRLAKKWNTVAILISQISRKQNDGEPAEEDKIREVRLHDAKESGSFENSCSVVLGVWKTAKAEMRCRVLKNTKGLFGNTVAMKIWGGTYIIDPA